MDILIIVVVILFLYGALKPKRIKGEYKIIENVVDGEVENYTIHTKHEYFFGLISDWSFYDTGHKWNNFKSVEGAENGIDYLINRDQVKCHIPVYSSHVVSHIKK